MKRSRAGVERWVLVVIIGVIVVVIGVYGVAVLTAPPPYTS